MAQEPPKEEEQLVSEIWNLIEPVIAVEGMEVLEIEYRRESMGRVLRIFIDSEQGVTVEDCARISRIAGDVLDAADLIPGRYHLEVSSPGLDRPLRKFEHFQKHIGDIVEIRTLVPLHDRRNFKGELQEVSPEQISVDCDSKSFSIPLSLVERARLLYFQSMERKSH